MHALRAAIVGAAASIFCTLVLLSTAYARADEPPAQAFDIGSQSLATALTEFARQSKQEILFAPEVVAEKLSSGVHGTMRPKAALQILLKDSGLSFTSTPNGAILVGTPGSALSSSEESETRETSGKDAKKEGKNDSSGGFLLAQESGGQAAGTPSISRQAPSTAQQQPLVLEEVIVTAQKREERLQDVPISISVLDGEHLDRSSYQGITEALATVPGVADFTGNQGGQTIVAVRGVAATAPLFAGSSTVAYYIDSVPFGLVDSAILPDTSAYDLQRIEVLRGPQGTLYGASALNGVVRILTNDADLNHFDFKGHAYDSNTDGGGNNYRGDLVLNAPVVEGKLAVRAVAGYQDLSGWIDSPVKNDVNKAELQNYRLKIDAQPTDQLSIGLSSWFSRQHYGAPNIADDQEKTTHRLDEPIQTDYDLYGLKIGYQFTGVTLTSNTSYIDYQTKDTLDLLDLFGIDYPLNEQFGAHTFAEELNLNSSQDGTWRWSAGAMYRDGDSKSFQMLPAIVTLDWKDTSKSYAVYGELSRRFFERKLEITLGGRYFHDDVTTEEGPDAPPINGSSYYTEKASFHATTPRAVLTWYPQEHATIYGSFSEGFRSGSPQAYYVVGGVAGFPAVQPDKLYNYEVGSKTDFFDRRLAVEAAVYYMDWKDVQQNLTVPFPGTANVPVAALVNANSASGPGVDVGITFRPVDKLELGITGSWNDLTFDSDVISAGKVLFSKGQRLNFSAKTTAGGSAAYAFPLGASGYQGRLTASANYTSSLRNTNLGATGPIVSVGDNILIARTELALLAPSHWQVSLFGDNLTNNRGRVIGNPAYNESPTPVTYVRNRPRTIGLQFAYSYL